MDQALFDLVQRGVNKTDAECVMFNEWRETAAGNLYCRLVLDYAPLGIGIERSSDPVESKRVYVGGQPDNVRFYVKEPRFNG